MSAVPPYLNPSEADGVSRSTLDARRALRELEQQDRSDDTGTASPPIRYQLINPTKQSLDLVKGLSASE